ncbi:fibroblast growth factor-binding protein 2 [Protopterus annectens]|uniref:fibroblast growth factor-binding protein 2 n=1 Tax=Protopterus annectens TaxID=7888 RepID=UPI001CFA6268|nr:fibroblast growth factor-binding protein 2 [Protopterus annectens]
MNLLTLIVILLFSCHRTVGGQKESPNKKGTEKPIQFRTPNKDLCIISIQGKSDMRMKVECKNKTQSYWCEYTGKPSVCRPFLLNPQNYWHQIKSSLKKLPNACETSLVLKPSMCQKAAADAHMKQVASSVKPAQMSRAGKHDLGKGPASLRQRDKPSPEKAPKHKEAKFKKPSTATTKPKPPGHSNQEESEASKTARQYCPPSLHKLCSYFIGAFSG